MLRKVTESQQENRPLCQVSKNPSFSGKKAGSSHVDEIAKIKMDEYPPPSLI